MNHEYYKCIIIGSGFSGICLAIKLKRAGIEDFVVLEKAQGVGEYRRAARTFRSEEYRLT